MAGWLYFQKKKRKLLQLCVAPWLSYPRRCLSFFPLLSIACLFFTFILPWILRRHPLHSLCFSPYTSLFFCSSSVLLFVSPLFLLAFAHSATNGKKGAWKRKGRRIGCSRRKRRGATPTKKPGGTPSTRPGSAKTSFKRLSRVSLLLIVRAFAEIADLNSFIAVALPAYLSRNKGPNSQKYIAMELTFFMKGKKPFSIGEKKCT